jgi:hypothetical protein
MLETLQGPEAASFESSNEISCFKIRKEYLEKLGIDI